MRAGRLHDRIILQSKTTTQNSYGEAIISWATQATVWGRIEPLSVKERFAQGQVQAEARVKITMRYYDGIDTTWRIKHADPSESPLVDKYYDIVSVINHDERNAMMTLMCRQGLSEDSA